MVMGWSRILFAGGVGRRDRMRRIVACVVSVTIGGNGIVSFVRSARMEFRFLARVVVGCRICIMTWRDMDNRPVVAFWIVY